ncbi:primosomal protein DnaI [Paenibacillus sp. HN-1]|uniref:primosomal protein DnaI n=1 Tax=Paenibacillus TaxID=44249 RepID=UPI001CA9EEF9|nr:MULTISPECIES: primosomal protein DnaI [Paenibacillus]MBY9078806.1 primosomal protein DnaI [Paenibacillus sp. CGMCC 1.18879]MBY9088034.1 primosomal protein DnaI [Paenibacillus sinensis]
MESMGEVLRSMSNPAVRLRSRDLERELLNHELVLRLRAEHPELDESRLRLHLPRLYQYVEEARNCASCPGLDKCPNDFQGHYSKLTVETAGGFPDLYERKTACQLQIARDSQERIRRRITSFYVDERVLNEGYDEIEIMGKDSRRAPAVGRLFQYIENVKENGLSARGLYLYGSFGTGKTFMMCYLLHELAVAGHSGVIVYMPDFIEELKSMMTDGAKLKETVDTLKNCDLLIFDDIGAENLNPWARDHVLGPILNYRMERKPTFYTSNYPLEGLEKHLSFTSKDGEEMHKGQRLMNRISPYVEVVQLVGDNQRGLPRS